MESLAGKKVKPELAAKIRDGLAAGRRGPAQWVLDWLNAAQDPDAVAAVWSKIVADENDLLLRRPRETSPTIVESLLQMQIAALRNAHRGEAAAESVVRLMKLHHGDPVALAKLLQWLTEQKDWAATRLLEEQFRATIAASPELLYLLAEAQLLRGDAAAAEKSAAQALKLNVEVDERSMALHFQAGLLLEERGRFDWAIHEWDYVARNAPPESQLGIAAAHYLSELYHDLDQDEKAAATLLRVEKAHTSRSNLFGLRGNDELYSVGELRARRYYFEACHWRDAGDRTKQRAALDAALATQAYDIEVLIECYHFSDSLPDYREKVRKLIQKKLWQLREQVGDTAAAQPCNELAWLVANTEGDLDEALRYSKRSLEIAGENGAFRDTLARVYEVKGDLDEAIKQQTAAAALSPHARTISKQLEALRAKKGKSKN
jgi:tetratricopeptide (TPR) repeat protein